MIYDGTSQHQKISYRQQKNNFRVYLFFCTDSSNVWLFKVTCFLGSVNNHDAPKNVDETKSLPMMKNLDAAEIELDHALNQCPHSNNTQLNAEGDLTDSGSSGSSLLGKLESVMSELQDTDEKLDLGLQNVNVNSNISDMQTDSKETIKIDLRLPQVR